MAPPPPRAPRYRTRILAIGAVATGALYVIGAPIFAGRIEDDLERRVPAELADAGYAGVTASFSGQDGTLTCERPLDDPEAALETAYDVWGVRAVELDRSCRVNLALDEPATTGTTGTTASTSTAVGSGVPTSEPDFETVADIIAGSPQLALLDVLVREAGLADTVGVGADPLTFFAPTDDAFDALPADVLARLRDDPELLRRVLLHHEAAGRWLADDLVTGPLATVDGGELKVVIDNSVEGRMVTVSGAAILTPDILARNGVVHVVDRVLVPDDVDLSPSQPASPVTASYDGTTLGLDGVVATEVERAALVAAAGAVAVEDRLVVDPDAGLGPADTARLAALVAALTGTMLEGTASAAADGFRLDGLAATQADRDAVLAVVACVDAEAQVALPPPADDTDAVDLEAELNAYVAANPIRFEPASAELTADAGAVLDEVARLALRFAGVEITVEGHTDSDGAATANVLLSLQRANAVRTALVDRGLDPARVAAEGFGSQQPVLVDGVEDKDASRRVEFRVVVAE